jgi:hypothetical protein
VEKQSLFIERRERVNNESVRGRILTQPENYQVSRARDQ